MKALHLATHLNSGGITMYILRLVQPLKGKGIELSLLSSGGEYEKYFHEKGAPTFTLNIRTKTELHPKLYAAVPGLVRLIRAQKFEVLHAHTRVTQVLAWWAQRFTGIPIVTTCHGFYKRRLGRRLLPAWGDCAIAISAPVRDHLVQDFHVPAERVRLINNAINVPELDRAYAAQDPPSAKHDYGFQEKDFVIGIIARLVEDKGHAYLIEAVNQLKPEIPGIRLLVVGEGRERRKLEQLTADFGLGNRVVFTGNVLDVSKPLAAMDVFALPATWREGFGLSIVEAMACRKPVIVSNIWALNALIEDDVTGILVEARNVKDLCRAILKLARDPGLSRRIGTASRVMVEQFFTIRRMADETAAVYRDLVGRQAGPAGPASLTESRASL